jgi:hypothetical protein
MSRITTARQARRIRNLIKDGEAYAHFGYRASQIPAWYTDWERQAVRAGILRYNEGWGR